MTISRLDRIALGSFIPPALGGLVFYVLLSITHSSFLLMESEGFFLNIIEFIWRPIAMMLFSIAFFGIPSVFYSLLMEFAVQKINNDVLVIFISILLGGFVASILGSDSRWIGGGVGFITGYYLRKSFKLDPANKKINKDT